MYLYQEAIISKEIGKTVTGIRISCECIDLKIDGIDLSILFEAMVEKDDQDDEIGQWEDSYYAVYSEIDLDTELDIELESETIKVILDICSYAVADKLMESEKCY